MKSRRNRRKKNRRPTKKKRESHSFVVFVWQKESSVKETRKMWIIFVPLNWTSLLALTYLQKLNSLTIDHGDSAMGDGTN